MGLSSFEEKFEFKQDLKTVFFRSVLAWTLGFTQHIEFLVRNSV